MQEQLTPEMMRLRRSAVEQPFATIKYRILGHLRPLMRGLSGARVEVGLASMAYNIKRMTNVLGAASSTTAISTEWLSSGGQLAGTPNSTISVR